MRMMLKASVDTEPGNRAIKDGLMEKTFKALTDLVHPEAAYFTTDRGKRTAYFVFDLQNVSQMPQIAEPLFMDLGADIEFMPVMNPEDLNKGLQQFMNTKRK